MVISHISVTDSPSASVSIFQWMPCLWAMGVASLGGDFGPVFLWVIFLRRALFQIAPWLNTMTPLPSNSADKALHHFLFVGPVNGTVWGEHRRNIYPEGLLSHRLHILYIWTVDTHTFLHTNILSHKHTHTIKHTCQHKQSHTHTLSSCTFMGQRGGEAVENY